MLCFTASCFNPSGCFSAAWHFKACRSLTGFLSLLSYAKFQNLQTAKHEQPRIKVVQLTRAQPHDCFASLLCSYACLPIYDGAPPPYRTLPVKSLRSARVQVPPREVDRVLVMGHIIEISDVFNLISACQTCVATCGGWCQCAAEDRKKVHTSA